MFKQEKESEEKQQIREWYSYQQEQILQRFREINTDAMEEIKNKMRRKQTKIENEENIGLIEKERTRICEAMNEHVRECQHPRCAQVHSIVLAYNLRQLDALKEDEVTLIAKYGPCTGYVRTDCPVGSQINAKMMQTHRIRKNM